MRRFASVAVTSMALALLVGGSGGGAGDSRSADSGAGDGVSGPVDAGGAPGVPTEADADRQVVTTGNAAVAVDDPAKAAQQVSELVEAAGGRVDERNEQAGSGKNGLEGASADLVVRVPADALTGLLADLEELGDVANVSVSHTDVTGTAVDHDARISALQTSVARLQALMNDAATTEALLDAEQALSDRQEELESLQSQRALLADQVDLSTLRVHLEPFGVAPAGGPEGFVDGLGTGWRALVTAVKAIVVVLGVLLPWLAVAALITAAVLVPIRMTRRRPAVAVAGPAQTPPQPPMPPPPAQE
jgi:hypothetical protein